MTNKQHPAQFDWATELLDAQGHVTLSAKEAHEIGARLRSMGEKLKAYEDLDEAASDVQLLRIGYAAARLEIESLQSRIKTMAEERADELMVAHLDGRMRAAQPAGAANTRAQENAALLADILNRRPAMNAGLTQAYAAWTAEVYDLMGAIAAEPANEDRAQPAPAAVAGPSDTFRGDTTCLVQSIIALLELDAEGALVPHGIGGHARALLSAAASRLAAAPTTQPAPQQEAPAMPSGWVSCTIAFDGSGPEEVAYGPKIMMDRLAKWLGKHFERTIAEKAAPHPSPTPQADSVLEDAARLDWLLLHISGAEFRRIGVHYSGNASRADVDAARTNGDTP